MPFEQPYLKQWEDEKGEREEENKRMLELQEKMFGKTEDKKDKDKNKKRRILEKV